MCAILEHLAELSLNGDAGDLKESTLGVAIFHREAGYDTQADPIVRVSIRRLRQKLEQFYAETGDNASCRIEIPLGAYILTFHPRSKPTRAIGSSEAPAGGAEARALSCCPGNPTYPAFCPDGNRLAFQWRSRFDAMEGIYIQHLGDDTPVRLSSPERTELRPVWSPDASRIALLRPDGGDRFVLIARSVSCSAEQSFGTLYVNRGEVPRVDWSPDGAWLLTSERGNSRLPMRLVLIDAHTGQRRAITAPAEMIQGDSEGVFAPDSRRIAFCRSWAYSGADLFVMELEDGGEPRQVTCYKRPIRGLCWGVDGHTLIAALCLHGSSPALWSVPLDGSEPHHLTDPLHRAQSPAVAGPRGELAYVEQSLESSIRATSMCAGGASIFPAEDLAKLQDGIAGGVLAESPGLNRLPQYSPSNSLVSFCSDRNGDDQLWVCSAEGKYLTRLTTLAQTAILSHCWSPAGDAICFEAHAAGTTRIFSVDLSTLAMRAISPRGMRAVSPAWSADGLWLYFATDCRGTWQIWRVFAAGGEPSPVTVNGGIKALESPDGEFLYYSKGPVYAGIWRKQLETGRVEMLPRGPSTELWANWTLGSRGIYWLDRGATGDTEVVLAGWEGEAATVGRVNGQLASTDAGLSVSRSGQRFLTAVLDHCSSRVIVAKTGL